MFISAGSSPHPTLQDDSEDNNMEWKTENLVDGRIKSMNVTNVTIADDYAVRILAVTDEVHSKMSKVRIIKAHPGGHCIFVAY